MSEVAIPAQLIPMGDALAYHAARDPDRPALTHEDVTLSRIDLDRRANRRARIYAEHGVREGDYVVLALPNSIEFFETTFALWKLGATPCPVSPKLPPVELKAIVDTIAPRLVIGGESGMFADRAQVVGGIVADPNVSDAPCPAKVPPFWKALTSGGSTGRPKVIVTRVPGSVDPHKGGYAFQRFEDTILNPGPLYHNAAFSAAHQCLFAGGHVINMARFNAESCLALIDRHQVNHVVMVPTMMSRIWNLPPDVRARYDMSSLRVLIHLAAPCPAWLKQSWIDWLGPDRIIEIYAGTEGIGATCISGAEWLAHKGSVGRVAGGAKMRILDEQGDDLAPGEVGEIYFQPASGPGTTFNYVGADAKVRDGWMSLGDLGWVDADGYLYLADRRTDLIISGGVNVYPAEVEAAIDQYPGVRTSVVIGLPDDDLGNRVHAIVQLAPEAAGSMNSEGLILFLRERLVGYKIPRSFEFMTGELRDEAGKARRSQLREARLPLAAG